MLTQTRREGLDGQEGLEGKTTWVFPILPFLPFPPLLPLPSLVVVAGALIVKLMSFDSLLPMVTLWVTAPPFSCHASIVYVPGGRPLMSNLPSSSVTAKNGWSR